MALSQRQFEDLKKQLEKRKAKLGDEEYGAFLQRAELATTQPVEEVQSTSSGFVPDFNTGVLKSVGQTALGVGGIGRKIQSLLSKGVEKVTGRKDFGMGTPSVFDEGSESNAKAQELLKRNTAGEKVGGFVGDVAQFAIPGNQVTKATKGLGFLKRASSLVSSDVVVQGAQQGGFDKDSIDTAIVSAIFPVAGKVGTLAKGKLPAGKDVGGRVVNSLIKPLLKDFSYGKNPGQAVAEAGITANSLDELTTNIRKVRQSTGDELGRLYKQSTAKFDGSQALKPLDDAIAEAQKSPRTNAAIIARLQNVKDDILQVGEDGLPARKLTDLSAEEMFTLKKDIGELTRWTGNATDDEIVNKGLKKTYGQIKDQLDEVIPEGKVLSEKYADLKSAEIATEYRDKIASRQNLIGFSTQQAGIAAGLVTAAATGGITVGLLAGATASGLMEAAKTPAFKTRLAAWLASASEKEVKDAFTQAPWLRGTLQTILFGDSNTETPQ